MINDEESNGGDASARGQLCSICYSNRLLDNDDPSTVLLACGHKFCSECFVAACKHRIDNGQVDLVKCLEHSCRLPIDIDFLQRSLPAELFEKYQRFKAAKTLDSDPLIRHCPKPGCETHIRALSADQVKLECPKCHTEVCFKCRDVWHGELVSCEENMSRQLEGWLEQNAGKVSFCPMCRTRIEKNRGCNHMTCAFCKYEFCWSCGASATAEERHFDLGRGCGVEMMDESIKPGDHLKL